jgi:hypothetical protein
MPNQMLQTDTKDMRPSRVRPRVPPEWKGGTPATVVIGKIAFELPIHTSWAKRHLPCSMIIPATIATIRCTNVYRELEGVRVKA